jgi:predicted acyltransferase
MYIPTPGYAIALLEPGKNLAAWIDSLLLPGKMWQGTWDPEGIFSTFPAVVTAIAGMLAGQLIVNDMLVRKKMAWLFISGLISCIIGYGWSFIFPLNKNLWTSSYVMVTAGLASIFFAISIFIVDIKKVHRLAWPGIVFGENAITVYVLAELLAILYSSVNIHGQPLNSHFMNSITSFGLSNKFASLLFALLCVSINFIPAYWLYKKKILIRI